MTLSTQLSKELNGYAQPQYAVFHSSLLGGGEFNVLGVRVPVLRKLAKKYYPRVDEIFALPDWCYEIKFIKLACAAALPYEQLVSRLDYCVSLIDNWALCDCFAPKCVKGREADFYKYVQKYFEQGEEFAQRFALTTLLHFYVKEEYLSVIAQKVKDAANEKYYYVHMASAWLTAEVLVKYYGFGVELLKEGGLDKRTHNKAIRKACESLRITDERKNYLKTLKR